MVDVQRGECINLYSAMNPFMDCVILVTNEADYDKAEKVAKEAMEEWFDLEDDVCWGEHIEKKLNENGIKHELYFKNEQEEAE